MELLYMIELFINKIDLKYDKSKSTEFKKKLTVNIDFGKMASFAVKQDEFDDEILDNKSKSIFSDMSQVIGSTMSWIKPKVSSESEKTKSSVLEESIFGKSLSTLKYLVPDKTQTEYLFNIGASFIFSSHPESLLQNFDCFPLELSIWNNDQTEKRECVGFVRYLWDKCFYEMVEASMRGDNLEPIMLKEVLSFRSEYASSVMGEITILLRLSSFGKKIITRFKEMPVADNGVSFLFRDSSAKYSYICQKYGINAHPPITVSPIYECLYMEDPDESECSKRRRRVTEELIDAGISEDAIMFVIGDQKYKCPTNDQIKIPCGDPNCRVTELIKNNILKNETQIESYKKTNITTSLDKQDVCSDLGDEDKKMCVCELCGGISFSGTTCSPREEKSLIKVTEEKKEDEKAGDCCKAPCCGRDLAMQKCLADGLAKMLGGVKGYMHKNYCPEYKPNMTCVVKTVKKEEERKSCSNGKCRRKK